MRQSILRGSISLLCLLGVICGPGLLPAEAATTQPLYKLDAKNRLITIHPDPNATAQINAAMAYLITRTDKSAKWTVKFEGGQYQLISHIYADKLENVDLVSDRANPAIIRKAPNFANEYMLYSRFGKNISVTGFQFYGKTRVYDPAMETNLKHPGWLDQGLYFASANGVVVDRNRFHDFGNAALRITTSESDPVKGVNSFNSTVTNNTFRNIFQVTTTSNSLVNGATAYYLFQNNNISNLHGSIKFASRTPGAANVWIRSNTIDGSTMDGFEVSSYTNLEMSYNRLTNIARHAVNCYTNLRATPGFQWGDNITFKNNVIDNANGGFRFDTVAYDDGFKAVPRNVQILNNTISNLKGTAPAINFVSGAVKGLTIQGNKLSQLAGKQVIGVFSGSQNVLVTGNTLNNQPYLVSK